MVKVCQREGKGFVDYMWPKPGEKDPVAKLSFVRLFKPWNWVIGTGVYLETAEKRFMDEAKTQKQNLPVLLQDETLHIKINETGNRHRRSGSIRASLQRGPTRHR